jgi:phage shock protein C
MFCTHCGQPQPDDARFCPQCGTGVEGAPGWPRRRPAKLFRLGRDRKVAGVCAGLAKYADIDVTIVRILWVAATLGSTVVPGVVAYILAWLIVPVEPEPAVTAPAPTAV